MRVQALTKDKMESMCRAAGMKPVHRTTIDGAEVFIADGQSGTPERTFQKFGVDQSDFPGGCYATFYFVTHREDRLDVGQMLFFDLFHNPEMSHESKQLARINTAVKEAKQLLERRRKVRH